MASSPSRSSAVFDASAIIRALVDEQVEAVVWFDRIVAADLVPLWPAHAYAEVAHTLVRLVGAGRLARGRAADLFAGVRAIPASVAEAARLEPAMSVAFERRLSVYDAAYVVLAEALRAPLVTADRRLANATEQGVLLPG